MPKYTVRSGSLNQVVDTAHPAKPNAIAVMAIMLSTCATHDLGTLMEISGGLYKGGDTVYVSTIKVLEDMGVIQAGSMISAG